MRERVSRQFSWIEISTRMLTNDEEQAFYRASFRNRPIVSMNGYDGTVHRGPFRKYRSRPIVMDGPDATVRDAFVKRLQSCPLDLDLTVQMLPARSHHDCYNALNKDTCFDHLQWTTGARDQRAIFNTSLDPTPCVSPRHLR